MEHQYPFAIREEVVGISDQKLNQRAHSYKLFLSKKH